MQRGRHHALDHVDRNGEAEPHAAAGARIDHRIDADQPAVEIDERAAGIARIDRRVGLDEEAVVARADLGARQRRHDALGHRLSDAERVADGDDEVADLERVRIAHLERRETVAALEAQHREVGARIAQHDLGLELAPVGERHPHLGRVLDDVKVGDDEARRIDEHARAERLLHAIALAAPAAAEEALEDRIVEQRVSRHVLDMRDVDVHHRRGDLLDHGREGQAHLRRALGRRLREPCRRRRRRRKERTRGRAESGSNRNSGRSRGGADIGCGPPR